jgi:menaquinone-dependent protoporphyrinogen oxidase
MMQKVLLVYSTVDGHTRTIVAHMARVLESEGLSVTQHSVDDGNVDDLESYDCTIIGASIRYGKHRPNVTEWINARARSLAAKPGAFFSVNLVARKPGRDRLEANNYAKKFLKGIDWQPDRVAIFAGKLDYPAYSYWDRQVIRLIMWMTKGPTNSDAVVDYTDWQKVEDFAREVVALPAKS